MKISLFVRCYIIIINNLITIKNLLTTISTEGAGSVQRAAGLKKVSYVFVIKKMIVTIKGRNIIYSIESQTIICI